MSKFCGNCGNMASDEARVCGVCGTPFAAESAPAPMQYNQPQSYYQQMPVTPAPVPKKKSKKGLVIGLVAIIAIIVAAISLFGGGSKGTVKSIIKAYDNQDHEALAKLCPDFMSDTLDEDYFESEMEGFYFLLALADFDEDEVKLSYEIKDEDEYDKDEIEEIADEWEEEFDDFDADKLQEIVEYEVEVTVKDDDDEEEIDLTVYSFKYGGKWYALSSWDI